MVDAETAKRLLAAREAHALNDYDEAFHQIYMIAEAHTDDPFEPWKGLKSIAASDEKGQATDG